MNYAIGEKLKRPVIIARSGKDKLWHVGNNAEFGGAMVCLDLEGAKRAAQPLLTVVRWLDESWKFKDGVLGK